jgi:hypothetical protein
MKKNFPGLITVEFALLSALGVFLLATYLEVSRIQVVNLLLERSVYDIAYQSKVARGVNFDGIVAEVLEQRNNGLFKPAEVKVTSTYSPNFEGMAIGGLEGSGFGGDIVHLKMETDLGVFANLVPNPLKINRTIDYYYINEPDMEDITDD